MRLLANGINVGFDLEGTGEDLVLIPGLGMGRRAWWPQVPVFTKYFRVLRYDLCGQGEPDKPLGPYSFPLLAADLEALLHELNIRRAHLIGLSMGGMIAQQFAIEHPNLVRTLTLISSASTQSPQVRRTLEERADLVEKKGLMAIVDSTLQRWFTPAFVQRETAIVERIKAMLLSNDPRIYANLCRLVASLDLAGELHKITAPTLIVVGDQDPGEPPEVRELTHDHIAGSQLAILSDAAHLCNIEAVSEFNQVVLDFLRG